MSPSLAFYLSTAFAACSVAFCMAESTPVTPSKPETGLGELSTDRPDFTESTGTIRPGVLQLEGGLLTASHSLQEGRIATLAGPYPLFRLGLTSRTELRLGSDGMQRESQGAERHEGLSDVLLGLKLAIAHERGAMPAVSVIGALSMPWGAGYFTSGTVDPVIKLCLSKSLPAGWDIGGNVDVRWDRSATVTTREHGYSLTSSHALAAGLRGFAEVYRISPVAGDEAAHWLADTGLSRQVGGNAHLDVAVGHTMNARTPYWFVSAGFAIRTPLWR